jgi:hypothetical protein
MTVRATEVHPRQDGGRSTGGYGRHQVHRHQGRPRVH